MSMYQDNIFNITTLPDAPEFRTLLLLVAEIPLLMTVAIPIPEPNTLVSNRYRGSSPGDAAPECEDD